MYFSLLNGLIIIATRKHPPGAELLTETYSGGSTGDLVSHVESEILCHA